MDDEDQDINVQLKMRRLRTKRLALLAVSKATNNSTGSPERRLSTTQEEEAALANPLVPLAASFFLERAQKRRGFRKESPAQKAEDSGTSSKPVKLERQCAVSGSKTFGKNGVATIGEESEVEIITENGSSHDKDDQQKKSEESEV